MGRWARTGRTLADTQAVMHALRDARGNAYALVELWLTRYQRWR